MRSQRGCLVLVLALAGCGSPEKAPDMKPAATKPAPRRPPTRADAREIFLDGFSEAETAKVAAALDRDPDFVDVTPGGGAPGRRVSYDVLYVGTDLKASLSRIVESQGLRFHFVEARVEDQVELARDTE
jgi:hypothetical protein